MNKEKVNWIDNLKAFGIFAVVLGHITSPFGRFIFSWHMPLFFILAGFSINLDLSIREFISKNIKRLILPYFIFIFLGFGAEIVKRLILNRQKLDYIYELKGMFIWMDMQSLSNTYGFVLWFLPTLFWGKLYIFLIKKKIKNISIQSVIIIVLFSLSFIIEIPFAIDNGLNSFLFIFIGNIFFKNLKFDKQIFFLLLALICIFLLFGIPFLDLATKRYENIAINLFWALSIVLIFVFIFEKVDFKNRLLTIWGTNTMLLFIIHPYTNNIAHIIVEKIQIGNWYLKYLISLIFLQCILSLKLKLENRGIFKFV